MKTTGRTFKTHGFNVITVGSVMGIATTDSERLGLFNVTRTEFTARKQVSAITG